MSAVPTPARSPSSRPNRRLTVGVVIAGFCAFLQLYATQPLLAVFRQTFHATEAEVSLTVSAATLAVAIASPILGLLADQIGRKRIIVPSLTALGLTTLACGCTDRMGPLIAWRFVGGAFTPGIIAVVIAFISEESPAGTAASVTSYYVTGTVLGGLLGRIVSAYLADHFGWRASFRGLAALTLAGSAATFVLLPRSRRFQRAAASSARDLFATMGRHLANRKLLGTYFGGFNILFSHVGLFTYASFRLSEPPFSLSTSALGSIFLVYSLGLVVTPLAGRAIDRLGHRAGIVLAAITITSGVLLTLSSSLVFFVLGVALASSGVFVAQAASSSHVGLVAEGSRAAASGLYVAFYYLGGSVGATALAGPWRVAGWPGVVLSIVAGQILLLALGWTTFSPARPAREAPAPRLQHPTGI